MNELYPIFLKLHELSVLVVGAGEVGHEKLAFMLKSSPRAKVKVVAPNVSPKVYDLLKDNIHFVTIIEREFVDSDVTDCDLVIAATNDRKLNERVRHAAKSSGKLVNVADTPALCDFYLGAIVTKGDLKVAISTNGQSPTLAKRLREMLEEALPDELAALLPRLRELRDGLKGDFSEKVRLMNDLTSALLADSKTERTHL
jgi:precorrin-2 dehydrogenase/sirohydrochlorin ferrochelatase